MMTSQNYWHNTPSYPPPHHAKQYKYSRLHKIRCQYHHGVRHAVSGLLGHLHGGEGGHVWDGGWRGGLLGQQTLGEKEEFDRRQKMGKEINTWGIWIGQLDLPFLIFLQLYCKRSLNLCLTWRDQHLEKDGGKIFQTGWSLSDASLTIDQYLR